MRANSLVALLIAPLVMAHALPAHAAAEEAIVAFLASHAVPLEQADDLDALLEGVGERRLVLLGESTHGTEEYYAWRAEISRRLIAEKDFDFVVVEGDWAALNRVNDFVKHRAGDSAREVLKTLDRWPAWMWGNTAIEEFAEWLREHNADKDEPDRVGFFGMDVYGPWEAREALLAYTESAFPEEHDRVVAKLACYTAHGPDDMDYARAIARGAESCAEDLAALAALLDEWAEGLEGTDAKAHFRATQHAKVLRNAEAHLRLSVFDRAESWNRRARHMWATVQRLLDLHGEDSRGIVWAHNTHVGDARQMAMGQQGMVNIGHLSRQDLGEDSVFIVGFGTNAGAVNAGASWGAPMQIMRIPEAAPGSIDHILAQVDLPAYYLALDGEARAHEGLSAVRGHRAIGVSYNPLDERGNYVPTIFPRRYDGFIFLQETQALTPVAP